MITCRSLACASAVFLSALGIAEVAHAEAQRTRVEVFARGLINPRGLSAYGDKVYVAETGAPGTVQIRLPVIYGGMGPVSTNGRVLELSAGGEKRVLAERLPNFALYKNVEILGVHGVAVHDGVVSYLTGGHPLVPAGIFTIEPDGTTRRRCNFLEIARQFPPDESNGDAAHGGNPYDMVFLRGAFYVSDGNYNRVVRIAANGSASVFAQWTNSSVTVGLDADEKGNLYVAQFGAAPYHPGSGRIDRIGPDGRIEEDYLHDLQTPIDVAIAPDGNIYVLQFASGFSSKRMRYVAGSGRLLRFQPDHRDDSPEIVVTGLTYPTSLAAAEDGSLYISNYGMESNDGLGEVLHVIPGQLKSTAAAPFTRPPEGAPTEEELRAELDAKPEETPVGNATQIVEILETGVTSQWGYSPSAISISVGNTVVFTNKGRMPHTVTDTAGHFDSGAIPPNGIYAYTPKEPGDFEFLCVPHPWMRGSLHVSPSANDRISTQTPVVGTPAIRTNPPPRPSVPIWAALALVPFLTLSALGVNRVIGKH